LTASAISLSSNPRASARTVIAASSLVVWRPVYPSRAGGGSERGTDL